MSVITTIIVIVLVKRRSGSFWHTCCFIRKNVKHKDKISIMIPLYFVRVETIKKATFLIINSAVRGNINEALNLLTLDNLQL